MEGEGGFQGEMNFDATLHPPKFVHFLNEVAFLTSHGEGEVEPFPYLRAESVKLFHVIPEILVSIGASK